jgi:hypothetical protein
VRYLELTCQTTLWVVFLAAAIGKAQPGAYHGFVSSLSSVRWLPARLAASAAVGIIVVEGSAVVALSSPRTAVVGYGLVVAALAAFTATAADALRRGEHLQCRCFGADSGPIRPPQLARNGALIAIALTGLGTWLGGAAAWPSPVVATAAIASGLAIAITVIRWADLSYLFGPNPHRRVT